MKTLSSDPQIKDSFQISMLNNTIFYGGEWISVVYNRVFIIHEGCGPITIDNNVLDLKDGDILFISKGQIFSFSSKVKISGFEIRFGDCFWEKVPASASNCKQLLFNDATLHQKFSVNEEDLHELDAICKIMVSEYLGEDYPNKLDALAAYLKILMIKLANKVPSFQKGIDDFDNQIYRKFLELLSKEYSQMRDVLFYADQLMITPRKLSEIAKKKSGKGAKEIIASQIIAESKRLLQFSAKTVKEIAYELSFNTPEQFSHFFKKQTNTSPVDHRKIFVNIGR